MKLKLAVLILVIAALSATPLIYQNFESFLGDYTPAIIIIFWATCYFLIDDFYQDNKDDH